MIGLTGPEEIQLRVFQKCLEAQPPLVNMLRQAVTEYIERRLAQPKLKARYTQALSKHRHLKLHP